MHHAPAGPLGRHGRRVGDALVAHGVDAAAERVEDVLVAPHDALGHARGAARVEDVEIVARARPEVPCRRLAGQRILVAHGPRCRLDVAAVLDHKGVAQVGQFGEERGDER